MGKRVLVIGAGVAGLSAASYLQRNGFDTEIFELHDVPGGLCASWKRGGYTFDGCIHWLMGSSPTSNLHHIWKELGAGELRYVEWDIYAVLRLADGDSFTVYTDPDLLEREILRLGPGDREFARIVASGVRRFGRFDLPAAFDKLNLRETASLIAALPGAAALFATWANRPLSELLSRVTSPKLREAFSLLYGDSLPDFPAGGLFMMLGFMAKRSNGYPIGGSLAFARAIEAKYLSLGGKISYRSKVDEILVEDGRAVGLRGAWGERRGDYVVSAADAFDTTRRLLGGRYPHPDLEAAFAADERYAADGATLRRFPSLILVGLGLGRDYSRLPHMQSFRLERPIQLEEGMLEADRLSLRLFHFDPSSAPEGKTAGLVMVETRNDDYWTALKAAGREGYEAQKRAAADSVVAALEALVPGIGAAVEVVSVATPATFIRYTNNWHGSFEGWLPTRKALRARPSRTLPGLGNFYMVGQWVSPGGGLPPCGISGRSLAKALCKAEGRRFSPD